MSKLLYLPENRERLSLSGTLHEKSAIADDVFEGREAYFCVLSFLVFHRLRGLWGS